MFLSTGVLVGERTSVNDLRLSRVGGGGGPLCFQQAPQSNQLDTGGGLRPSGTRAEALLLANHPKILTDEGPERIRSVRRRCLKPWRAGTHLYLFKEGSCCMQMFAAPPCFVLRSKNQTGEASILHGYDSTGRDERSVSLLFPQTRRQNGVINIPAKPVAR